MTLPHRAGDPFKHPFGTLPHYYGDIVRALFIAAAVLTGLSIPLYADVNTGAVLNVPVIIVLLVLAGLMSPTAKFVMILSAIAAGVGVVLGELAAVAAYGAESYVQFVVLELLSLTFIVSLYFAVKDVRTMTTGQMGQKDDDNSEYLRPNDAV